MKIAPVALALSLALSGALGGCGKKAVEAPYEVGVCFNVTQDKAGKLSFHKVAANLPSLEYCAGALEAMRLKFLGLGGTRRELTGAYQGQFLFLRPEGIFSSPSLDGMQYLALVRTGDGRLVAPGAARRP